jgi:hypothetical protein
MAGISSNKPAVAAAATTAVAPAEPQVQVR